MTCMLQNADLLDSDGRNKPVQHKKRNAVTTGEEELQGRKTKGNGCIGKTILDRTN